MKMILRLFIHGGQDTFIAPRHSEAMQKATRGYSELHLISGAGHAESVLTAPMDYLEIVRGFFKTIQLP